LLIDKGMGYRALWMPSQYGNDFDCLHRHRLTVLGERKVMLFGLNPVPLWRPSQKG